VKTLVLLRHAKSAWDDPTRADIDRPLNERGVAAAATVGRHLRSMRAKFDCVLVSAARRAVETWTLVAAELDHPPPPTVERTLYLCGRRALLTRLRALPETVSSAILVAHNPDLHDLACDLAKDGEAKDLARLREHFPTGALVQLRFDGTWGKLAAARLESYTNPRQLEAR
jgi:phosphohistidine phosphatase